MIKIVLEHDDFYVAYKPAKVNFHDEGNLGEGFFNHVKTLTCSDELYPVHRLDKLTSGLIILARNKASAVTFQHLFSQHKIDKYYLALSKQKPKKKQGLIKGGMSKSRRGAYKLDRSAVNPAITQFFSSSVEKGIRLFLVKPLTGKTHQIRVALASIGAPILGDELYAKGDDKTADRGYLHAFHLAFDWQGEFIQCHLPPTEGEYFEPSLISAQLSQWQLPSALAWPKNV